MQNFHSKFYTSEPVNSFSICRGQQNSNETLENNVWGSIFKICCSFRDINHFKKKLCIKKSSDLYFCARSPDVDCPATWGLVLFVSSCVKQFPGSAASLHGGASAGGHSGQSYLVTAMGAHQYHFSEEHS